MHCNTVLLPQRKSSQIRDFNYLPAQQCVRWSTKMMNDKRFPSKRKKQLRRIMIFTVIVLAGVSDVSHIQILHLARCWTASSTAATCGIGKSYCGAWPWSRQTMFLSLPLKKLLQPDSGTTYLVLECVDWHHLPVGEIKSGKLKE